MRTLETNSSESLSQNHIIRHQKHFSKWKSCSVMIRIKIFIVLMSASFDFKMADISYTIISNLMWFLPPKYSIRHQNHISSWNINKIVAKIFVILAILDFKIADISYTTGNNLMWFKMAFKMADISYTTGNNLMWFIDSKNVVVHTKIISLAYKY